MTNVPPATPQPDMTGYRQFEFKVGHATCTFLPLSALLTLHSLTPACWFGTLHSTGNGYVWKSGGGRGGLHVWSNFDLLGKLGSALGKCPGTCQSCRGCCSAANRWQMVGKSGPPNHARASWVWQIKIFYHFRFCMRRFSFFKKNYKIRIAHLQVSSSNVHAARRMNKATNFKESSHVWKNLKG